MICLLDMAPITCTTSIIRLVYIRCTASILSDDPSSRESGCISISGSVSEARFARARMIRIVDEQSDSGSGQSGECDRCGRPQTEERVDGF